MGQRSNAALSTECAFAVFIFILVFHSKWAQKDRPSSFIILHHKEAGTIYGEIGTEKGFLHFVSGVSLDQNKKCFQTKDSCAEAASSLWWWTVTFCKNGILLLRKLRSGYWDSMGSRNFTGTLNSKWARVILKPRAVTVSTTLAMRNSMLFMWICDKIMENLWPILITARHVQFACFQVGCLH